MKRCGINFLKNRSKRVGVRLWFPGVSFASDWRIKMKDEIKIGPLTFEYNGRSEMYISNSDEMLGMVENIWPDMWAELVNEAEKLTSTNWQQWAKDTYFNPETYIEINPSTSIKCQRCKDEGKESHSCPYKEEINGDYDSKCNCCESCRQECLYDI